MHNLISIYWPALFGSLIDRPTAILFFVSHKKKQKATAYVLRSGFARADPRRVVTWTLTNWYSHRCVQIDCESTGITLVPQNWHSHGFLGSLFSPDFVLLVISEVKYKILNLSQCIWRI